MTAVDVTLGVIGGFYVFAGVVGARAAVAGRAMDRLIDAIERAADDLTQDTADDEAGSRHAGEAGFRHAGEAGSRHAGEAGKRGNADAASERAASVRGAWLLAGSLAVLFAGATLVLRLDVAPYAFVAAALLQAVYLFILAPLHLDAMDPVDDVGRRQTTNAFVLFAAATAYVMWAGWRGAFVPIATVRPELLAAVSALCVGFTGYTLWSYTRPLPSRGDESR